jgi:hypothetical protein
VEGARSLAEGAHSLAAARSLAEGARSLAAAGQGGSLLARVHMMVEGARSNPVRALQGDSRRQAEHSREGVAGSRLRTSEQ